MKQISLSKTTTKRKQVMDKATVLKSLKVSLQDKIAQCYLHSSSTAVNSAITSGGSVRFFFSDSSTLCLTSFGLN